MTLTDVAISALVEDFSIYPRHAVDPSHVAQLAEAIRSGATDIPPIIADKDTLRIVDGWHRARAYARALGPDAKIKVDVRNFKSPHDLISAAVAANVRHGRRLDRIDRVRCALLLQEAGFSRTEIAVTLQVRQPILERMVLQVAPVPAGSNSGTVPGTNQLPLKRAAGHLAGQLLTTEQTRAHHSLPGTSLTLLARQLTIALRADFVDITNERLHSALLELYSELKTHFEVEVPV